MLLADIINKFNNVNNDDDIKEWITVKGNHIPIKEGETKKEAVEKFINKKWTKKEEVPRTIKKTIEKNAQQAQISTSADLSRREKNILKRIYEVNRNKKEKSLTVQDLIKDALDLKISYEENPERFEKALEVYKKGDFEVVKDYEPKGLEEVDVYNPDWRPLYDGTDEKKEEIIMEYDANTDTPHYGRGYSGYSMSKNAELSYKQGLMPLSKWSKEDIIKKLKTLLMNTIYLLI